MAQPLPHEPVLGVEITPALNGRSILAAVLRDELGYLLNRERIAVFDTEEEAKAASEILKGELS